MRDIYVYGAGGFGMEVVWLIEDINRRRETYRIVGYLDDNEEKWGGSYYGYPVVGGRNVLDNLEETAAVGVAIGDPKTRREVVQALEKYNVFFPALIHPSVMMSRTVEIGEGVIIAAGSILTADVSIGMQVHVDICCSISHGSILQDYCRLNPKVSVSGNSNIGKQCYLGSGATIVQGLEIGEGAVIGAGAVVIRDVPGGVVAVGNPARVVKGPG
jgi:sugar O-acyltransferase (sialic acid O-acetyltransferase NeuD family)